MKRSVLRTKKEKRTAALWSEGRRFCSACNQYVDPIQFNKRKASKDGLAHTCRSCLAAYQNEYMPQNSEAAVARATKWNRENRDTRIKIQETYRKKNPEKIADCNMKYMQKIKLNDPDKYKRDSTYRNQLRRRRVIENGGTVSPKWWNLLFDYIETKLCIYCGKLGCKLVMDHFIPLAKGGRHEVGNLIPVCSDCNARKHSKMPQDFLTPQAYESAKFYLRLSAETLAETEGESC